MKKLMSVLLGLWAMAIAFTSQAQITCTATALEPAVCEGHPALLVLLTVTGGTAPYNAVWFGPKGGVSLTAWAFLPAPQESDEGTYRVVVIDANGQTGSVTVELAVNQCP